MSNFRIDDIRLKIKSLRQKKNQEKDNMEIFPFADITRDTLNQYKKGIFFIIREL
jgi:hypothetical protein